MGKAKKQSFVSSAVELAERFLARADTKRRRGENWPDLYVSYYERMKARTRLPCSTEVQNRTQET
jgi:hypothetical protein